MRNYTKFQWFLNGFNFFFIVFQLGYSLYFHLDSTIAWVIALIWFIGFQLSDYFYDVQRENLKRALDGWKDTLDLVDKIKDTLKAELDEREKGRAKMATTDIATWEEYMLQPCPKCNEKLIGSHRNGSIRCSKQCGFYKLTAEGNDQKTA